MFNAEALYPYNISRTEFKTEMPDKAQLVCQEHAVSQRQYVLSEVNVYIGDMLNIYL